ncbi:GntR family transcriptional regulator [Poseidonocella sp. HB161398]|uniref:GntR family transcriptional regulator n=1 Tax=Poseidonocella sp. HB161398 TaxID=2320855 RepID=UPI00110871B2|nr:GntR family transcriptional regulator [Poseidonocella sp. HB161398]
MARKSLPKIERKPVEVQAIETLREAIVTGAIEPGERITEINLSEEMNLSRATLRSALHQLAQEGLVTLVPYTGWRVLSLGPQDVRELYTLRSALERLAAQLVAAGPGGAIRESIGAALADLSAACAGGTGDEIAEADFALHKAIIAAAGHGRLMSQYRLIEQQIRMYIRSSDALLPGGAEIYAQHVPMVEAILAGDAERAGQLAEEHNLAEGRKLTAHLAARTAPA